MNKKIYLNEKVPTSNSIPNVYYALTIKTESGEYTRNLYTVDDVETFVNSIRRTNETITSAERINTETSERVPFIPETRQEKTDRENRARCQCIAAGNMYRCPECGEEIKIEDLDELTRETEDGETVYCLPCGCETEYEPEQLSLYDYFADVLDIEYRVGSDKELRSVSLMVACGGPNIYIDTAKKAVLLYWWTDRAEYPISHDVCEEIDAYAEELWNC